MSAETIRSANRDEARPLASPLAAASPKASARAPAREITLGLDLGSHALKAVLFRRVDGKVAVERAAAEPTPRDAIRGTFTQPWLDARALEPALDRLMSRIGDTGFLSRKHAVGVALPDALAKFVPLEFETASRREGLEYLRFRVARSLPPGVGTGCRIDVAILPDPAPPTAPVAPAAPGAAGRPVVRVGALLTRERVAEAVEALVSGFGGELVRTTSASANLVNLAPSERPRATLVHIGHETTVVTHLLYGVPVYQRVIEIAGRHFEENLAAFGSRTARDTAGSMPSGAPGPGPTLPDLEGDLALAFADRGRIEAVYSRWLLELSMTIRFLADRFHREAGASAPPDRYLLSGGAARLANLPAFLARFLGAEVAPLASPLAGTSLQDGTRGVETHGVVTHGVVTLGAAFGPEFLPALAFAEDADG